jgi:hypothetical protein
MKVATAYQIEQADYNQIYGTDAVQRTRSGQNENTRDQRYKRVIRLELKFMFISISLVMNSSWKDGTLFLPRTYPDKVVLALWSDMAIGAHTRMTGCT